MFWNRSPDPAPTRPRGAVSAQDPDPQCLKKDDQIRSVKKKMIGFEMFKKRLSDSQCLKKDEKICSILKKMIGFAVFKKKMIGFAVFKKKIIRFAVFKKIQSYFFKHFKKR